MITRRLYLLFYNFYCRAPRWLVRDFGLVFHVVSWLRPR